MGCDSYYNLCGMACCKLASLVVTGDDHNFVDSMRVRDPSCLHVMYGKTRFGLYMC